MLEKLTAVKSTIKLLKTLKLALDDQDLQLYDQSSVMRLPGALKWHRLT